MSIEGKWRIREMDLWDQEAIDLFGTTFIEFSGKRAVPLIAVAKQ